MYRMPWLKGSIPPKDIIALSMNPGQGGLGSYPLAVNSRVGFKQLQAKTPQEMSVLECSPVLEKLTVEHLHCHLVMSK